jgi:hypothetical protein
MRILTAQNRFFIRQGALFPRRFSAFSLADALPVSLAATDFQSINLCRKSTVG